MYKVVISDLDGTLLNSRHQISEFTRATIRTLVDGGVKFVVATGRHIIDARGISRTLGFDCDLITANGALVSTADEHVLFHHTLAATVADDMLRLTRGRSAYDANVFMRDGWYVNRDMPEVLQFYQESGFAYTVTDLLQLDMSDIHKICFTGDPAALSDLKREFATRYPQQASVVFSANDCLDVTTSNVNKGNAAHEMLALFGLGVETALAFGDSMNDYELLDMAGTGYLMGNAATRLRQALPDHPLAEHCDDDGVARRLIAVFGL